jgi:hypothetical protein
LRVTTNDLVGSIPSGRIAPIKKEDISDFGRHTAFYHGSVSKALDIRDVAVHRYHVANTFTQEFLDMVSSQNETRLLRVFVDFRQGSAIV